MIIKRKGSITGPFFVKIKKYNILPSILELDFIIFINDFIIF